MAKQPDPLKQQPWYPPDWELADAASIQACIAGTATPEQQKRCLGFIVEVLSARSDMSFRPGGEEGRRNTDFAEGRRFVGNQILKLSKVNLAAMRRKEPNADEPEQKA